MHPIFVSMKASADRTSVASNQPESAVPKATGLGVPDPMAPLEHPSARRTRAADVLAAVADLVSTGLNDTNEAGSTFVGLARRLEELEAKLSQGSGRDNRPETPGEPGPAATGIDESAKAGIGGSAQDASARNDAPPDPAVSERNSSEDSGSHGRVSRIELDAAIRHLSRRMAAIHKESLRRAGSNSEAIHLHSGASTGVGAETAQASSTSTADPTFSDAPTVVATILRRLEAKVDALVSKISTEASSANRHQSDLLARRIESTELQLVKRVDSGFAAAAVEIRVLEDMVRALAARSEAQGDIGAALATLAHSVRSILDRLDRIEDNMAVLTPFPATAETGPPDAETAPEAPQYVPTLETEGAPTGEAIGAIHTLLSGIAERLQLIETHLGTRNVPSRATGRRTSSIALPWWQVRIEPDGPGKGQAEPHGSTFVPRIEKTRRASRDLTAQNDVLIEPGSGSEITLGPEIMDKISACTDEDMHERTDFIEAARRAVRAARGFREPHITKPEVPEPEVAEGVGMKARRFLRSVKGAIFRS
jgi:hypothetical protein